MSLSSKPASWGRIALYAFAVSACAITTSPSYAASEPVKRPSDIPVEAFAKLPQMSQPELSPDARHLAYLSPIDGQQNLIIAPLGSGGGKQAIPPVEKTSISWFRWVNNERLVISYRYTNDIGDAFVRTALFSVHVSEPGYIDMAKDPKTKDANPWVHEKPQIRDRVIDYLPSDPDHILLAIDSDFDGRSEIRRVDVATGNYKNVTEGYDWIRNWVTDQNHQYRLGWGNSQTKQRVVYIEPDGSHRDLNDVSWFEDDGIEPIGFTTNPAIAYAIEPFERDKKRLITFNVMEGKRMDVVFEHPEVDISGYISDPRTGTLIGASYTDDLPRAVYFRQDLKDLQVQLDQLIPGGSNEIVSWNDRNKLYVVSHISDRGTDFYLINLATGSASPIGQSVPIPPAQLAHTQKHVITARDGVKVPSYLTLPNGKAPKGLPLVVLPHGGPHARDDMTYDYWSQFLASRGYAVLRPNFRGSDGYGERFRNAGEGQWGGLMQDDVTDATKWAIDAGVADPKRICIVGGSYGGYAALMGAIKEPDLYACAASLNGVGDLTFMVSRLKNKFWMRNYSQTIGLDGERTKSVSPFHQAQRLKAPVLLVHAKDDPVVPFEQAKATYKQFKKYNNDATFLELKSADHYFDNEQSRIEILTALEKFLGKHIGKK